LKYIESKQKYRQCNKKADLQPRYFPDQLSSRITGAVNTVRPSPLVDNTARWSLFTNRMTETAWISATGAYLVVNPSQQ